MKNWRIAKQNLFSSKCFYSKNLLTVLLSDPENDFKRVNTKLNIMSLVTHCVSLEKLHFYSGTPFAALNR